MGVCPFIVIERHSRVSDRRAAEALAHTPSAMELGKPSIWILGVAKTADTRTEFIQGEMHFLAGPWVRRDSYSYVDGKLARKVG